MKYTVVFLCNVVIILTQYGVNLEPIMGGSETKISKVSYYASVVEWDRDHLKWSPVCGATILSDYWVISASHCFVGYNIKTSKIRTGIDEFFSPKEDKDDIHIHGIENVIYYPNFEHHEYVNYNDICLVKLIKPIKLTKNLQWPINLPNPNCAPIPGKEISIVGFGLQTAKSKKDKTYFPTKILLGKVKIMDQDKCAEKYSNFRITDNLMCATSKKQETSNGDSGGPAVMNSQLVGIISSGGRGLDGYPGVYTAVHKYVDWIVGHTGVDNIGPVDSNCCLKKPCKM